MSLRPEIQRFAEEMELAIQTDGRWWPSMVPFHLYSNLLTQAGDLPADLAWLESRRLESGSYRQEDSKYVVVRLASIANTLMMLADRIGGLTPKETL